MIEHLEKFEDQGHATKSEVPENLKEQLLIYHPAADDPNDDPKKLGITTQIKTDRVGEYIEMSPTRGTLGWSPGQKQLFSSLKLRLSQRDVNVLVSDPIRRRFTENYVLIGFELAYVKPDDDSYSFEANLLWEDIMAGTTASKSKWFWVPD